MSDSSPPPSGEEPISQVPDTLRVGRRERLLSPLLFFITLVCVFWVYGTQWEGGEPFTDGAVAWESAKFAMGLMAILLAHEMGHYFVARMHGFELSLPIFIPFPAVFGTFGAIIRLRSLPRSRNALLEMGAAGPIAGFIVALVVMALGLSGTVENEAARVVMEWPPSLPPPPPPGEPAWWEQALAVLLPTTQPGEVSMAILANPPVMDLVGWLINGQAPGRYAELDPLAMAGWVGCLLTAVNLLPIGQLDGGHVLNALWPERARTISKLCLGLAALAGLLWSGWIVWAVLLWILRAWISLPVPVAPGLSPRACRVAGLTLLTFVLSFMPRPVELESIPLEELSLETPEGDSIDPAEVRAWMEGLQPPEKTELESSRPSG